MTPIVQYKYTNPKPIPLPRTEPPGHPAISGLPPHPTWPSAIKPTSDSVTILTNGGCALYGRNPLCVVVRKKKQFFLERCLKVLVKTFQTLRLVIKRVKLIDAFSATGSHVTHLAPQDSKGTDPNEHLKAEGLP